MELLVKLIRICEGLSRVFMEALSFSQTEPVLSAGCDNTFKNIQILFVCLNKFTTVLKGKSLVSNPIADLK
jgi:hypothetical protein